MSNREHTCTFTGHRPTKLPWGNDESDSRCTILKKTIYDAVLTAYEIGYRDFICGMAEGGDLYFAEAVLSLQASHDDVRLEAAIPYEEQAKAWSSTNRDRYDRILASCYQRTLLQTAFTEDCLMNRNRYMVDKSSLLLAAYNGSSGGTRNTMLYAMRKGVQIVELTTPRDANNN